MSTQEFVTNVAGKLFIYRLSFLAGEQLHQVADSQIYCRRQMLMLSQEEHATIYRHTEAESQIR